MNNYLATDSTVRLLLILSLTLVLVGCGGASASGGLPSDKQVLSDVMPADKNNVVDISVTEASGEPYLHKNDLVWYYDRGVVIKRKANMQGVPKAVVVVGGLARYVKVGDRYDYLKFLTTYNEYEGIPAPKEKKLKRFVADNLSKVFVSQEHKVVAVDSIDVQKDAKWVWHNPRSFSVPFVLKYDYVTSNTTVESRQDILDIRFYRNSVDEFVNNLMSTEKERKQLATKQYAASEIQNMKTLRSGLDVTL